MKIEVGKEVAFARHRLSDIIFLAENSRPVDGDWEGYAKQLARIVAENARDAKTALSVV